ncbi:isoprenylcysteine carboxylmethyltransferase family protein [archaeon]|nr:isoprenylcysteine carboxylmethyltransferase family protein [archaeon]MBT6821304.1 isoprenylcysteine carboxylmethyltransferase family protein [archaeon]
MKLKSIFFVASFVFFFWIFIPRVLMNFNSILGFIVFSSQLIKIIGYIVLVLAFSIIFHMTYLFVKYGKGTPSITEPTKKLVRRGIYKKTRNPMYISNTLVILGIFFLNGHLLLLGYAIIFFISMHLFLVYVEEPELKKKFGKPYEKFLEKIPRWIPRFK